MYEKPTVERFGTFRDLTMLGYEGVSDGYTIVGTTSASGCEMSGCPRS